MNVRRESRVLYGPSADAFCIAAGVYALVLAAVHISNAGGRPGAAFVIGTGGGYVSLLSLRFLGRRDGGDLPPWRMITMLFGFFAPLVAAILSLAVVPPTIAKGAALGALATVLIGMTLLGPSKPLRHS